MDSITAEVVTAWRSRGIDCVLIKGPSVAGWLYDATRVRSYGDSDLLVAPAQLARARETLTELGFVHVPEAGDTPSTHASTWWRQRDNAQVDLHASLWSASAPPQRQWEILTGGWTQPMRVGGTTVSVPVLAGRALLVALHAAQHLHPVREKPAEDLRRALEHADLATWQRAAALADALGAVYALAMGLSTNPDGKELARDLPGTREWLAGGAGAVGLARVLAAGGAKERSAVLLRTAFPDPEVMRWWSPLARRGRRGLAAAYALRVGHLLRRAPASAVAWHRNRQK